jgi:hypothetical protein
MVLSQKILLVLLVVVVAILAFHPPQNAAQTKWSPTPPTTLTWVHWTPDNSNTFYEENGKIYIKDSLGDQDVVSGDPESFEVAEYPAGTFDYRYAKDKVNVYYISPIDGTPHVLNGADPATFNIVIYESSFDAQDKNHTYFLGQIVR